MSQSKKKRRAGYRHPVPDRNRLLDILDAAGQPCTLEEIAEAAGMSGSRALQALKKRLQGMVSNGQVVRNRRDRFLLAERLDLIAGAVRGHPDGFGFVLPDDGSERIHLSPREMRALFDGDRVTVQVAGQDRRGRPYGRIVDVLDRGSATIVGHFIRERGIGLVMPDNARISHRVLVPQGKAGGARPGDVVVARILDYPTEHSQATGQVVEVLGREERPGIATDIAIHSFGLPNEWPAAVKKAVGKLRPTVPTAAKRGRRDLRDTPLVTIDGADARDFDDAVHCERTSGGWRLLVAIADVSHYVHPDDDVDREARSRGTSAYFPDRVVPMLPEELSNGLCSLNPQVDRLCMLCEMRVSSEGKVTRARFEEAVMRSAARLTYSQVQSYIDRNDEHSVPKPVQASIDALHDLYRAFARRRSRRGAIELDIPQTRISVDDQGVVTDIAAVLRNDAHRLIEECMIAANVQAARFLRRHRIPGLYRNHARPDADSFGELREYLLTLGLKVPHPEHVKPEDFNRLIRQTRDRADSAAISMTMLRSLPQAEYRPEYIGHFGLALTNYAHFTSPIRRYPDLLVHRAIRHIIRGGKPRNYHYDMDAMLRLGQMCSAHERRAEDATREVEALLKCQFMEKKIGEVFQGIVTGVTNFGLFVQLEGLMVDGLVHISSLDDDYYHFDPAALSLDGDRNGRRFALGDRLKVCVRRVDLDTRRIDLALDTPDRRRNRRRH